MTIIISAADEDEARDLDKILGAGFGWPYRIFLLGREFRPDPPAADPRHAKARELHPACKRLYQLLIEAGYRGHTTGMLWTKLRNEGLGVARQTVHDWLAQAEQAGLVTRFAGQHGTAWRWRP